MRTRTVASPIRGLGHMVDRCPAVYEPGTVGEPGPVGTADDSADLDYVSTWSGPGHLT